MPSAPPAPPVPSAPSPSVHAKVVLVTGFGPFLDVTDNPSGRLAASVDGEVVGDWTVVGKILEVSYAGAPARTIAAAKAHDAGLVIGLGVDSSATAVRVERCGHAGGDGTTPDIDDAVRPPAEGKVPASIDVDALAAAMGVTAGEDPGGYVCNAWLYDVATALPDRRVGFVHLPPEGLAKERLLAGIAELTRD